MRLTFSIVAALVLLAAPVPAAAETVGLVQRLQNTAYGTQPEAPRAPKRKRDGIAFGELIETAGRSALEIGFIDGSNLVIGADARVLIDAFVFDGDNGEGRAALTLARGAVRWITGVMPPGDIRLETPRATITLRGTNIRVAVRSNGDSLVALDEGEVTVVSRDKGEPVKIAAGSSARVSASGVEVIGSVLPVADPVVDNGWFGSGGNGSRGDSSGRNGSD